MFTQEKNIKSQSTFSYCIECVQNKFRKKGQECKLGEASGEQFS